MSTVGTAGARPVGWGTVKSFEQLYAELAEKAQTRPEGSGTVAQLDAGVHAIGKKIVEEAAEVWAGVVGIFRDYGYRRMRTRARLKFLIKDWGVEKFRQVLETEYLKRPLIDGPAPTPATRPIDHVGVQKLKNGLNAVGVAPIAGRVGLRTVDVGNVVSSSDANGVALITAISPIDVEFAVPQDQAPMLQQNAGEAARREERAVRVQRHDAAPFLGLQVGHAADAAHPGRVHQHV